MLTLTLIIFALVSIYIEPRLIWGQNEVRNELLEAAFMADVERVTLLLNLDPHVLSSRSPVLVDRVEEYGRTPLLACGLDPQHNSRGRLDKQCTIIAEMLHKAGANMTHQDREGWDALAHGAVRGLVHYCRYLLQFAHVPVDTKDQNGRTALMKAAAHGYVEVVDLLLSVGANVSSKDSKGQSALHFATLYALSASDQGQESSALRAFRQMLPRLYSSPELCDEHGRTALMYAAIASRLSVAQALLEIGADPRLRDGWAVWTPNLSRGEAMRSLLLEAAARRTEREHEHWQQQDEQQAGR
jgi:hypothetical protein